MSLVSFLKDRVFLTKNTRGICWNIEERIKSSIFEKLLKQAKKYKLSLVQTLI